MRVLLSIFIFLCIWFIGSHILYGEIGLLTEKSLKEQPRKEQTMSLSVQEKSSDVPLTFSENDWNPLLTLVFAPKDNQANRPVLSPPPSDPIIQEKEYQTLKKLQKNRDQKQERLFRRAHKDAIIMLLRDLKLYDDAYSSAILFFYEGWAHISGHVYAEQLYHARLRPTQQYNDLESFAPLAGSPSYPSDMTAQTVFMALLAGDLFPEYDYLFQNWANQISDAFEASAFQFPSDTIAGREIAMRVFNEYKQSPSYKDDQLEASLSLISYEFDVDHFKSKLINTDRPQTFP